LIGFVFALSSTAVVLRALGERQETDAPHGRFIVGVLIFQDLIVVAMLLVIPALGDKAGTNVALELGLALGKAALVVAGALLIARFGLPRALAWAEASRSREVFGLALVAVCLGTAWLTAHMGLSLALGAFLAGLLIADSDYAHRALEDVIPVRDVLTSLFFVSMGMLFNVGVVIDSPVRVLVLLAGFVLGKGLIASLAAMAMRFPARVAWLAGAALAQFGEFGFVLATEGERAGLISRSELEPIFAAGLLSMFATRMVISLAPRFAPGEALLRPLERLLRVQGIDEASEQYEKLSGHVVIVGYGPGGRALSKRLSETKVPYLILELNAQTVRTERDAGVPIYYGDVTSREARHHAGVERAGAIVLQISDRDAAARAVSAIRADGALVPIFIRARRRTDAKVLESLGADHVVCEEETASAQLIDDLMGQLAQGRAAR
jgi:CPA2 family monovalent cation:H+ antiporter-2